MPDEYIRHGDVVQVKTAAEILATLDDQGTLDGLPFMPEMAQYLSTRQVVDKRAERICDTIYPLASNRLPDAVLLGQLRCDGSAHDGCQSDCRLYWKEAWLRRTQPGSPPPSSPPSDEAALPALLQLVGANTQRSHDGEIRYKCQHTQLSAASKRLRVTDPRAYLRVYTTGNVGLLRFLRVMARAIVEEPLRKLGVTPRIFVSGTATSSDRELPLNLQPGDLVQVKSKEEIVATLTPDGRNRGLFFDREMLPYCGGTFRVKKRVTRFIDDRSGGKMISLKTDCLTLEGVVCSGELSVLRWFCPREIQSFWREAWLRRVDSDQIGSRENATRDPDVVLASELHAGRAQLAADELDSTI